jgi:hypothetical protein
MSASASPPTWSRAFKATGTGDNARVEQVLHDALAQGKL